MVNSLVPVIPIRRDSKQSLRKKRIVKKTYRLCDIFHHPAFCGLPRIFLGTDIHKTQWKITGRTNLLPGFIFIHTELNVQGFSFFYGLPKGRFKKLHIDRSVDFYIFTCIINRIFRFKLLGVPDAGLRSGQSLVYTLTSHHSTSSPFKMRMNGKIVYSCKDSAFHHAEIVGSFASLTKLMSGSITRHCSTRFIIRMESKPLSIKFSSSS